MAEHPIEVKQRSLSVLTSVIISTILLVAAFANFGLSDTNPEVKVEYSTFDPAKVILVL